MPPPTTRLPSVDLLRILVVIAIVWRHTWPTGGSDGQSLLSTASVLFFFFLTGWLWSPQKRTVKDEVKSRSRTLLIPYVGWFAVATIVAIVLILIREDSQWRDLLYALLGGRYATRPFTTFWFFTALFVTAVALRMLDRVSMPWKLAMLVGTLTVASLAGDHVSKAPWAVGVGALAVSFALIAQFVKAAAPSATPRRLLVALVALPASVAASIPLAGLDLKNGDFGTPYLSSLIAIAFIWSLIAITDAVFIATPRLSAWLARPLATIASVAIVVVLAHPIVLAIIDAPTEGAAAWMFIAALGGSWAAALLVANTRLAPVLIGPRQ